MNEKQTPRISSNSTPTAAESIQTALNFDLLFVGKTSGRWSFDCEFWGQVTISRQEGSGQEGVKLKWLFFLLNWSAQMGTHFFLFSFFTLFSDSFPPCLSNSSFGLRFRVLVLVLLACSYSSSSSLNIDQHSQLFSHSYPSRHWIIKYLCLYCTFSHILSCPSIGLLCNSSANNLGINPCNLWLPKSPKGGS